MSYIDSIIENCQKAKIASPRSVITFETIEDPGVLDAIGSIRNAIYIIREQGGSKEATFCAFSNFKQITDRACPKRNIASDVLYVGSSTNNLKRRIQQHIGNGAKNTYALHLKHWFAGRFQVEVFEYDVSKEVLQIIEDDLSHRLKPAFGKKGGNNR